MMGLVRSRSVAASEGAVADVAAAEISAAESVSAEMVSAEIVIAEMDAVATGSDALAHKRETSLAGNIITTYAARFASLVAYVLLLPIVLGAFGADAYGLYVLTVSVGALFQQDLGVGDATTRFIAIARPSRDVARMRSIASASAVFYLAVAVVMTAGTAAAFIITLPRTSIPGEMVGVGWWLALIGAANVFFILAPSTNRQILSGMGRLSDVNLLLIGQAVIRVVLTVTVCMLHVGIIAVALVDLFSVLVFGLGAFLLRRRRAPQIRVRYRLFRWSVFRELFSVSAQLMVIGLAGVLVMQIGGIISALLLPLAFTALYAAGQRTYLLVKEVTYSLSTAMLPTAAADHGRGAGDTHREMYVKGTSLANMLMMLVLVPALIFMPVVMGAWIGAGAAMATVVSQILMLSMLANNNHLLALPILTARGSVGGYALLHTIWAVSGTALAFGLGSWLGLAGIALGLTLPIFLLEPFYIAIALRELDVRATRFLGRSVLIPFGVIAPVAFCLYLASLWLHPDLLGACLLSAGWVAVALVVYYFFGLGREMRGQVKALMLRRSPRKGETT